MSDETLIELWDDDNSILWCLLVAYRYRPPVSPVMGWRDGGDPGDGDELDVRSVEYMGGEFRYCDAPTVRIALKEILPNGTQEKNLVDSLRLNFSEKIHGQCLEIARRRWMREHAT